MNGAQVEVVGAVTGFAVFALRECRQGKDEKEGCSQGKFFHAFQFLRSAMIKNCGA